MANWDDFKDLVVEACRKSASIDEFLERVVVILPDYDLSLQVTYNALQKVFKRWGLSSPGQLLNTYDETFNIKYSKDTLPISPVEKPNYIDEDVPRDLVILPDLHYPHASHRSVDAVMAFIRDIQPEMVVQLGDSVDFYGLSSFPKDAKRILDIESTLYHESISTQPFWDELVANCDSVHLLKGNHEYRWERFINENISLYNHPSFTLESVLQLPDGVTLHSHNSKLRIGNITICHGDRLLNTRGQLKHVAQAVLAKNPHTNYFFGHFHCLDVKRHTIFSQEGEPIVCMAACLGHLSNVEYQNYVSDPNWQEAFAYIEFYKVNDKIRFTPHIINIVDNSFIYNGLVYDGNKLQ